MISVSLLVSQQQSLQFATVAYGLHEPSEKEILDLIVVWFRNSESERKVWKYLIRYEVKNVRKFDREIPDNEEPWMTEQIPTHHCDVDWFVDVYLQ